MSTQLILFPQDYNGYAFSNTMVLNEYASNITFTSPVINTVTTGALYDFAIPMFGANPPVAGNWRAFHTNISGLFWSSTTAPSLSTSTNLLTLYSSSGGVSIHGSLGGVYQYISGLTVGTDYRLTITHSSLPSGSEFWIGVAGGGPFNFDGDAIGTVGNQPTILAASGTTTTTYDFVAAQSGMKLVVAYNNTTAQTITVSKISLTENPTTLPQTYFDLYDGQVICDLYQEEDIPLSLSIDNFKNVAEKTQSYSKDFDLPATKRNNKIFTHIFDITKTIENTYDFNPYLKTKAILKQEGLLIFEGSLRLIEIKNDEGEISYNVNLFSETIALKEVLDGRTFAQLNLSELNHEYNYTQITLSWEGEIVLLNNLAADSFALVDGLATNKTNVIKYPFVDWTGTIDCIQAEPEISRLEDAFRPWISVKYLLDNIARDAGYTFQSAFFDSATFAKLYVDFNWGNEEGPNDFSHTGGATYNFADADAYAGTSATTWVFGQNDNPDDFDAATGWDLATNKFVCQANNTFYSLNVLLNWEGVSSTTINYIRWVRKNVSGVFGGGATYTYFDVGFQNHSVTASMTGTYYSTIIDIPLGKDGSNADELYLEWEAADASAVKQDNTNVFKKSSIWGQVYNNADIVTSGMFNSDRGEIKQWEFLKGIMTMFNMITMPDPTNPNNIIIEPYADMFITDTSGISLEDRSIKHDWTEKIDVSKLDLKPMDLKKEVIFRYAEDEDDYPFKVYKTSSHGFLYGSKTLLGDHAIVGSNQVTNLSGIEEVIAEPFAATIIKPIQDNFPNFIIPVIYGAQNGWEFEGISNLPRILYNNGKVTQDYDIPAQNGVDGGIKNEYLQFSHLTDVPSTNSSSDFNFGPCSLFPGVGAPPPLNLFQGYHAPYFDELYNANTRTLKAKVLLNAADINTFDFRDKVMIKNRIYRVNKIDYKPNALSTVEFILIP